MIEHLVETRPVLEKAHHDVRQFEQFQRQPAFIAFRLATMR